MIRRSDKETIHELIFVEEAPYFFAKLFYEVIFSGIICPNPALLEGSDGLSTEKTEL